MAEVLEGMTAAITLLTTLIFVTQWVVSKYRSMQEWVARVDHMMQEIAVIRDEFRPNGGSSLYDRLSRIEENHRFFWASYPEGVYQCEASGEWKWVNHRMTELFGVDSSEMLGRGWLMAVDSDQRGAVWASWQEALTKDIPYEDRFEITNRRTGERLHIQTLAVVCRNGHGTPVGYLGMVRKLPTQDS